MGAVAPETNKQTTHSNATKFYSEYLVLFLGYKCTVYSHNT
jgi:hypothetical protein